MTSTTELDYGGVSADGEREFLPGAAATLYVVYDPLFFRSANFSDDYLESLDNWWHAKKIFAEKGAKF